MDSGAAKLRQGQRAGGRQLLIQFLQDLHLQTVKDKVFLRAFGTENTTKR
jgi:hypothetical protein